MLDVACGTGLHVSFLSQWYSVEGLDLSDEQPGIARSRLPEVQLYWTYMTKFDTGKKHDAVTCLFSAVGELLTLIN